MLLYSSCCPHTLYSHTISYDQWDSIALYSHTLLTHSTHSLYAHTVLTHSTHTLYSHTQLRPVGLHRTHCTHTLYPHTLPTHSTHTLYSHTLLLLQLRPVGLHRTHCTHTLQSHTLLLLQVRPVGLHRERWRHRDYAGDFGPQCPREGDGGALKRIIPCLRDVHVHRIR
jgi:hypothetical protein